MLKCAKCGWEQSDEANFCMKCGAPIVIKPICPKCKKELPEGSDFCMFCGASLKQEKTDDVISGMNDEVENNNEIENDNEEFVLIRGKRVEDKHIRDLLYNYGDGFKGVIDHLMNQEFGEVLSRYDCHSVYTHGFEVFDLVFVRGQYDFIDKKLAMNNAEVWKLELFGLSFDSKPIIMAYCDKSGNVLKVDYCFDYIVCPTIETCKAWGIPDHRNLYTTYSHCRRRGFGAYEKDDYFPEMKIDEVKKAMVKREPLYAVLDDNRRYELKKLGKIGAYVVAPGSESWFIYEIDGIIIYQSLIDRPKIVGSMVGIEHFFGIQSLRVEGEKLIVRYFTNIRQTESNEEHSICGDLGSEFRDEYEADTKEIYIDISFDAQKKWAAYKENKLRGI